jgi:hypothetical protein
MTESLTLGKSHFARLSVGNQCARQSLGKEWNYLKPFVRTRGYPVPPGKAGQSSASESRLEVGNDGIRFISSR